MRCSATGEVPEHSNRSAIKLDEITFPVQETQVTIIHTQISLALQIIPYKAPNMKTDHEVTLLHTSGGSVRMDAS
jgi:hypothetical protein